MTPKITFFEQVGTGFSAYGKAFRLLVEKGLWKFLFFPLLILVVMVLGGYSFAGYLADLVRTQVFSWVGIQESSTGWLHFFSGIFQFLLGFAIRIALYFIFSSVAKFVLLIVFSPVMGYLSEKTEELLTGRQFPFRPGLFAKNVVRGIAIALRNLFLQTAISVICFFLCFVPVIGWFAPILLLVFGYYFYGFSLIDYVHERWAMSRTASISRIRELKYLSLTLGFVFALLFAVPYLGIIFAPVLAPIAASVAVLAVKNR